LVITYACCDPAEYRLTGGSDLSLWDQNSSEAFDPSSIATVTGPFQIVLNPLFEQVASLNQFSQQAIAFSCPEAYLNQLQSESLNMYFDKPFHYKNDSIPAGTNLRNLDELKFEVYFSELNLNFTDSLMNYLAFDSSAYQLHIEVNTTDGIAIKNGISINFDLE